MENKHGSIPENMVKAEGSGDVVGCPHTQSDIELLLKALWRTPELQHQIGTLDRQSRQFRNIPVRDVAEACRLALELSESGADSYFACAEYKTADSRKADNAAGAWGFWVDIDCGDDKAVEGKGYRTPVEACEALANFCQATGVPMPTHIVESGGGAHAYWMLDSFVAADIWKAYGRKLKVIARSAGLLADPTRTADIASVLRVPGTQNHKYAPSRTVTLTHGVLTPIDGRGMLQAIDDAHIRFCGQRTCPAEMAPRTRVWTPATAEMLNVLQACLDRLDPDLDYPHWYRTCAAICNETAGSEEGYAKFDAWSKRGTKYKGPQETRKVWRSVRPEHPWPANLWTLSRLLAAEGYSWGEVLVEAERFDLLDEDGA